MPLADARRRHHRQACGGDHSAAGDAPAVALRRIAKQPQSRIDVGQCRRPAGHRPETLTWLMDIPHSNSVTSSASPESGVYRTRCRERPAAARPRRWFYANRRGTSRRFAMSTAAR